MQSTQTDQHQRAAVLLRVFSVSTNELVYNILCIICSALSSRKYIYIFRAYIYKILCRVAFVFVYI